MKRYGWFHLEMSTCDSLSHELRLSDEATTHAAVQRQPGGTILWRRKRWGVNFSGEETRAEGKSPPVPTSEKSWVLKASWTSSIVSVV